MLLPVLAACSPPSLQQLHPACRLHLQQQADGRLQFGASSGPSWWQEDRDGPWKPGYWVVVEGGANDGQEVVIALADVGAGLKQGDTCVLEPLEDGSGWRCVASSAGPPAAAPKERRRPWVDRARQAARPVSVVVATVAVGFAFAQFAPRPDARENLERCERLISGSIEAGDRLGAERWLAACDASVEKEAVLAGAWLQRWGEEGPPPMVQARSNPPTHALVPLLAYPPIPVCLEPLPCLPPPTRCRACRSCESRPLAS